MSGFLLLLPLFLYLALARWIDSVAFQESQKQKIERARLRAIQHARHGEAKARARVAWETGHPSMWRDASLRHAFP